MAKKKNAVSYHNVLLPPDTYELMKECRELLGRDDCGRRWTYAPTIHLALRDLRERLNKAAAENAEKEGKI